MRSVNGAESTPKFFTLSSVKKALQAISLGVFLPLSFHAVGAEENLDQYFGMNAGEVKKLGFVERDPEMMKMFGLENVRMFDGEANGKTLILSAENEGIIRTVAVNQGTLKYNRHEVGGFHTQADGVFEELRELVSSGRYIGGKISSGVGFKEIQLSWQGGNLKPVYENTSEFAYDYFKGEKDFLEEIERIGSLLHKQAGKWEESDFHTFYGSYTITLAENEGNLSPGSFGSWEEFNKSKESKTVTYMGTVNAFPRAANNMEMSFNTGYSESM